MDNGSGKPHREVTVCGMTRKIMVDTTAATGVWNRGVGSAAERLSSGTPPRVPEACGPALHQALTEAADDLRRGQLIGRHCLDELTKGFLLAMRNLENVEAVNAGILT